MPCPVRGVPLLARRGSGRGVCLRVVSRGGVIDPAIRITPMLSSTRKDGVIPGRLVCGTGDRGCMNAPAHVPQTASGTDVGNEDDAKMCMGYMNVM